MASFDEEIHTEEQKYDAVLFLYVNELNPNLREIYKKHVEEHNKSIEDAYPNAGFDLFVPEDAIFISELESSKLINLQIKAEMKYKGDSTGYYVFPRSSISKTPLMLANHTGIIDSGYRGFLMAAFRSFSQMYTLEKNTRIVQICHPSLCPIYVKLVDELSDTTRGSGGFGSTGSGISKKK